MNKTILTFFFLTFGLITLQAQEAEDLDAKYAKDLLSVGTEAPDFTITDPKTGEKTFQLSDMRPKTVDGKEVPGVWTVIDFWATWCGDCRRELPTVKEIHDEFYTKVQMVGVSFDTDTARLHSVCKLNDISWPQYCENVKWKDTKISGQYNIKWLPTMYLIDPHGKVAFTTVEAKKMQAKLKDLVKKGEITNFQTMPQYPGGVNRLVQQINSTMKYPKLAEKYGLEARVLVGFKVMEDGSMTDFQIKKFDEINACHGKAFDKLFESEQESAARESRQLLEEEAIRAVKTLKNWIPGQTRGKVIKVNYFLPITFRLR